MTTVTLDDNVVSRLEANRDVVTIASYSGRIIGVFIPSEPPPSAEERNPGISVEELDRREKAGGGRTLEEIMADWNRK